MTCLADTQGLWPLAIYAALAAVMAGGMVALSYVLGQRHRARATGQVYESGIVPTGSARRPLPIHYFRVAVLFVIFDLEAVFIFAWACCVRESGWAGWIEMAIFAAVLLVGLWYVVRMKALSIHDSEGRDAK